MILCRVVAGEAEILTVAVGPAGAPPRRRPGPGDGRPAGVARQAGAGAMFLEVAVDNAAAIGLYERLGLRAGRPAAAATTTGARPGGGRPGHASRP